MTCADCPLFASVLKRCLVQGTSVSSAASCSLSQEVRTKVYRGARRIAAAMASSPLTVVAASACSGGAHLSVTVQEDGETKTHVFEQSELSVGSGRERARVLLAGIVRHEGIGTLSALAAAVAGEAV